MRRPASGLALAQFLLQQGSWLRGKRVLDFGAGSGVVAIAAAKAGAKQVIACDIDSQALKACAANAALNNVEIELSDVFDAITGNVDVVIAADVLYDRTNLPLLQRFRQLSKMVLVADSRIRNFSVPPYVALQRYDCGTFPDLDEFDEFRHVTVYGAGSSLINLFSDKLSASG